MSDSKISNKKYTVNTYEWTGEEIYFLGKYLEAQADILKQAGGRWAAAHGPSATIEIPNLSVLTTSLESVGKVAWDMRSTVQLALMKKGDNKERDELIKERRKWENLIADETNEGVLAAYQNALDDTLDRLAAAERSAGNNQDDKYEFGRPTGLLLENDPLSKLWTDESLSMHEREMIQPVVRHMMNRRNIDTVYQALNLPWHEACDGMSRNDADLLRWAFSRFGFRWRTSDDKTRFDMPVERFKFAKSRERIKDLRAAGNRWDKPFDLKLLKEDGRGKAVKSSDQTLQELLQQILEGSDLAYERAAERRVPANWLNKVAALVGYFPSMLPQGVWAATTGDDDKHIFGYASDLSKLLREIAEKQNSLKDDITLICSALPKAYYLQGVTHDVANIISLEHFIELISVIVFRWTADVELTIAEEVWEDDATGEDHVVRWHFPSGNPVVGLCDMYGAPDEELLAVVYHPVEVHSPLRHQRFFKVLPEGMFDELEARANGA